MFGFMEIADGLYLLYKGGVRLNDVPLNKEELIDLFNRLELSEVEMHLVEVFYGLSIL